MAKILVLCFALVALTVIAESKSLSNAADICQDCPEAIVAEEAYKRTKRAEAPVILNSISGLVNGILDTNWRYIAKINADKMNARRRTVIIGPGSNNHNRVMFNSNQGYDYNDYGRKSNGYDNNDYGRQSNGYDNNDYGRQSNGYDNNYYGRQSNGYDNNDYDSKSNGYDYNDYGSRSNNGRNQRNYNGYNNYNEY